MKHVILKNGLFRRSNKNEAYGGELSFTALFKRVLDYLGVSYSDPCCEKPRSGPSANNTLTVGGGRFQIWNPVTQEYDDVCDIKTNTIGPCTGTDVAIADVNMQFGRVVSGSVFSNPTMNAGFLSQDGDFAKMVPNNTYETVTSPGPLAVDGYFTMIKTTSAAEAYTLADGTVEGQVKKVLHHDNNANAGTAVLTLTLTLPNTTITFTTVGEYVVLLWAGSEWTVIEIGNYTISGAHPVIA